MGRRLTKTEKFDLSTRAGRARANRSLMWTDHAFLRRWIRNFHWVTPQLARSNQPSPNQIADLARAGIRTIVNLRGESDNAHYFLEKEACEAHGLALENLSLLSTSAPPKASLVAVEALFERLDYPALLHCKSGADRTGMVAALYLHMREGVPLADALDQLSPRFLHLRHGGAGILDFLFESYLAETAHNAKSFTEWAADDYDPDELNARFRGRRYPFSLADLLTSWRALGRQGDPDARNL